MNEKNDKQIWTGTDITGKLKRFLAIVTEQGEVIVIPQGATINISRQDYYPSEATKVAIKEAEDIKEGMESYIKLYG